MTDASPSTLVLIRHGETTWNAQRLVQGHLDDATLTPRGREQALAAAATLGDGFDLIVSSDSRRARETADLIASVLRVPILILPALRERNYGVLEGGPISAATADLTGIGGDRVVDADAHPVGGESLRQLFGRTARAIDQIVREHAGQRVLVVTHGGAIRTIRAYCEGTDVDDLAWDRVTNCSVWPVRAPSPRASA
jgi:broad specificity phosphatase PhoE